MKNVKKVISAILSGAMALTICAGAALPVSAVDYYTERESQYDPGTELVLNDNFEKAESLPLNLLYNGNTYLYLTGNFNSNAMHTDTSDFYKFSMGSSTGNKGRVAIILDGVSSNNNFDLYLYDKNHNCIDSSVLTGNKRDVVRTPLISSYTDYYLEVRAEEANNTNNSVYKIFVEDSIEVVSGSFKLAPTTLNTKPDVWSTDAYRDLSHLPSDAVVLSAKVSAKKSSSSKGYNNVIRVKIGNGDYETVTWKSGDVNIPGLVGQKCNAVWYAGFKASVLTSTSVVSMSSFEITLQYEHDKYINY